MFYFNSDMEGGENINNLSGFVKFLRLCLIDGMGEKKIDAVNDNIITINTGYKFNENAYYLLKNGDKEVKTKLIKIDENNFKSIENLSGFSAGAIITSAPVGGWNYEDKGNGEHHFINDFGAVIINTSANNWKVFKGGAYSNPFRVSIDMSGKCSLCADSENIVAKIPYRVNYDYQICIARVGIDYCFLNGTGNGMDILGFDVNYNLIINGKNEQRKITGRGTHPGINTNIDGNILIYDLFFFEEFFALPIVGVIGNITRRNGFNDFFIFDDDGKKYCVYPLMLNYFGAIEIL